MSVETTDFTEISSIVNKIASKVILVEGDDIQGLGEILQLIGQVNHPDLKDYSDHIRGILEHLILDEYEDLKVGIEHLNDAVEQLQIAFTNLEQVSSKELSEKQAVVDTMQEPEAPSTENGNGVRIEMEEAVEAEQVKQNNSKDKKTAKSHDNKTEAPLGKELEAKEAIVENPKPQAPEKPKPAPKKEPETFEDLEEEEEEHTYFAQRDNHALILQTIKEDPELVQGFLDESTEQLTMIENGLISWEESPTDLSIIDNIFRPFHTIKGVSGFLNLTDINSFAHIYEDLLDDARKGVIVHNEQISDVVFAGIDALKSMIEAIGASSQQKKYVDHGVDLERYAQLIADARAGKKSKAAKPSQQKGEVTPVSASSTADASTKTKATTPSSTGSQSRSLSKTDSSVKVSTGKMDNLIDLVGELVVTQNMVVQNEVIRNSSEKRLQRDIGQLKRITSSLQDLSMSLRMVPIKDTFQRMHRIVRDIARKSGKKIVLETYGEDTEIDRNMVEELYEPLVHMIRNNCDHGVESPADRRKLGKSETGTLRLNAFYKGGMVVIEASDDGKGIDSDQIMRSAIKKGLAKPGEKLSEPEILNFIFSSGFSTSAQITDISGRGVGMDVVRKAITKLRGSIEVRTKVNKGTTFALRLPLTLAIIDGVIVRIGKERYIIPTLSIKESMTAESGTFNKIVGKGETIFIRGRIIPLLRMNRVFGIEGGTDDPKEGLLIIVESDGQEAALLVDEMLDKQEIVIKTLGDGLNKIEGLAGGAIMSDGNVGLIVDIPTLLPKSKKMRLNTIND